MPGTPRSTFTNPTTPWGAALLLNPDAATAHTASLGLSAWMSGRMGDANAGAELTQLGCSAYTQTLVGAADSGAMLRLQNLPVYNTADYASVNALVAAAGAGPYIVQVNAHTHVTANLTLGGTIDVVVQPGANIEIDNGFTFTIADPSHVHCGMTQQAFVLTGTGLVAFTDGGMIWAGWWGLSTANAAAANATAVNAGLAAAFANYCDLFIYGSENTAYACGEVAYTNSTGVTRRGITIQGIGRPTFDHSAFAAAEKAWAFEQTAANYIAYATRLINLRILGPEAASDCWNDGGAVTTSCGISAVWMLNLILIDVEIKFFETAYYATDSYLHHDRAVFWANKYGLSLGDNCTIGDHRSCTYDTNYVNVRAVGNVSNQTFVGCLMQHAGLDAVMLMPGAGNQQWAFQFINPYFEHSIRNHVSLCIDEAGADVDGTVMDLLFTGGTWSTFSAHGGGGYAIQGPAAAGGVHSVTILNAADIADTGDIGGKLRDAIVFSGNTATNALIWIYGNTGALTFPVEHSQAASVQIRTKVITVDVNDDASTDDYQFDDDAANSTKQTITLTSVLPSRAELISYQIRCLETVTDSQSMLCELGTSSGGAEICTGSPDSVNDMTVPAAGSAPALAAQYGARHLYFSGTPGRNWNTLDAGRWAIQLTYLDYTAAYDFRTLAI